MVTKRTPWWYLVIAALVGLVLGSLLTVADEKLSWGLLGAPWIVDVLLLLLAIVVLYLGYQVHVYATTDPKKRTKNIDPSRATTTLMLAKALSLASSVLIGWYLGQLLLSLQHIEADYYRGIIIECAVVCVVSIIDCIAGLIAEYWCQLPPNKGPEHPDSNRGKGRSTRVQSVQPAYRECTSTKNH